MDNELIIIDKILENSNIERSFIVLLKNEGLIDVIIIEGREYVHESQLANIEHFANLYYELSINVEGIDVIQNLLQKINDMEQEIRELKKVLNYHRNLWRKNNY